MMETLDKRLMRVINELEVRYDIDVDQEMRNQLIEGVVVGYSPENTFEKAVEQIESRLLNMLSKNIEIA